MDAIAPYVRPDAFRLYAHAAAAGQYTSAARVDVALLSRLRAAAPGGFANVRGVREGLEYRLADAVRTATTAEGLADALTTARYPRARMRRLCADAALGVCDVLPLPPYLHVLGGKQSALGLLKTARLPASTSLAKLAGENEACAAVAALQSAAADFAALCRAVPSPMGEAFTDTAIIVRE